MWYCTCSDDARADGVHIERALQGEARRVLCWCDSGGRRLEEPNNTLSRLRVALATGCTSFIYVAFKFVWFKRGVSLSGVGVWCRSIWFDLISPAHLHDWLCLCVWCLYGLCCAFESALLSPRALSSRLTILALLAFTLPSIFTLS